MADNKTPFALNDAVHVSSTKDNKQLEGVVQFVGNVDFADNDVSDPWIGVRLTGPSVGLGKHQGSVQGKQYFEAPANSGLFIKAHAVSRRPLTRLEELRLRRELNAAATGGGCGSAGSAPASTSSPAASGRKSTTMSASKKATSSASSVLSTTGSHTPPRPATTRKTPPPKSVTTSPSLPPRTSTPPRPASTDDGSATTTKSGATTNTTARTKLEELRLRRAALAEKKEEVKQQQQEVLVTTTTSMASRSATTTELQQYQYQVETLQAKIHELETLHQNARQDRDAATHRAQSAEQNVTTLQQDLLRAKNSVPSPVKTSPTTTGTVAVSEQVQDQLNALESAQSELLDRGRDLTAQLQQARHELDQSRAAHSVDTDALWQLRSEYKALQSSMQHVQAQHTDKQVADATQYKERARLQAEVGRWQRQVEELQKDKLDLERHLEDLTLDKEQLQEEKEELVDKMEEMKLDMETFQMEAEELKMELEDVRMAAEGVETATATAAGAGGEDDVAEQLQVLRTQNVRMREALIRLREQTTAEKMEWSKQLRAAEKQAAAGQAVHDQVQRLRATQARQEEEIAHLKESVDQNSAYESMVEDLSDRIMTMEEDRARLDDILRDLEEAGELAAEMEEVQADEIKGMSRDLESRDTMIRNLEEAIKMQRRREDDFHRTVGNYRTTVETLKQEKQALLELQQGRVGEKDQLMASSQKAMARAAQLVHDAANMRHREAQMVLDQIDRQIFQHMSSRLEALLPHNVSASELDAIRGELLTSKVIGKASRTLEGLAFTLSRSIRPALGSSVNVLDSLEWAPQELDDELKQQVTTIFYEADFAVAIVNTGSDLLRLLAAGQWPDVLSPEHSLKLASVCNHSVGKLDTILGDVLKSLKMEGVLTSDQLNVAALKQTVSSTIENLLGELQRPDDPILPSEWEPPGWRLMRNVSVAKFELLGVTAALSEIVHVLQRVPDEVAALYNQLEQLSRQAISIGYRCAAFDMKDDKGLDKIAAVVSDWKSSSEVFCSKFKRQMLGGRTEVETLAAFKTTVRNVSAVSAALRGKVSEHVEIERFHPFSPEADDSWSGIAGIAKRTRMVDGDANDVNYLLRARALERKLEEAVEKEAYLETAQERVMHLENALSSRTKELSLQQNRLAELEKMIAKSSSIPMAAAAATDSMSSEERNKLLEENRVLSEAVDVLQQQVDEYETEIRALKDFRSPGKRGAAMKGTPRRSAASLADMPLSSATASVEENQLNAGALEAALFRPVLHEALQDAARWRSDTVATAMASLPPLPTMFPESQELREDVSRMETATWALRREKASYMLVDLTDSTKSPRLQLRENNMRCQKAKERLEIAVARCQRQMSK